MSDPIDLDAHRSKPQLDIHSDPDTSGTKFVLHNPSHITIGLTPTATRWIIVYAIALLAILAFT